MRTSDEGVAELAGAVARASVNFPVWVKSGSAEVTMKKGGKFTYTYGELPNLLDAIRPYLGAEGVWVTQLPESIDSVLRLTTRILHEGGGWIETDIGIAVGEDATVQELGSAITYLRRYVLQSAFGLAAGDDDGHAAGQAARPRQGQRRQQQQRPSAKHQERPSADAFMFRGAPVPGLAVKGGQPWARLGAMAAWLKGELGDDGTALYTEWRAARKDGQLSDDEPFHVGGAWAKLFGEEGEDFQGFVAERRQQKGGES